MNDLLLTNLTETFARFVNELELSFEYIKEEERVKLLELTTLESFKNNPENLGNLNSTLEKFSEEICKVQFAKGKISSNDYSFLKNITLFDFFSFEPFLTENKNTKRSIVNYLYSFYIFSSASDNNQKALEMIESLQKNILENVSSSSSSKKQKKNKNELGDLSNLTKNLRKNPGAMNDVGKLVSDLMGNKEIMSIANDVSKQFQENKIDPTQLMSSLMSGDMNNPQLKSIFENVSSTIEQKISDGSIDKDALEDQTNSIMSKIAKTNLGNLFK